LEGEAAGARLKAAEAKLAELRGLVAGAGRLEESQRMLQGALAEEKQEGDRLPELETSARLAEERAANLSSELETHLEALGAHRSASHQAEMDRARWRDRVEDLRRQLRSVDEDLSRLGKAAAQRATRVAEAEGLAQGALEMLPGLKTAAETARAALASAE